VIFAGVNSVVNWLRVSLANLNCAKNTVHSGVKAASKRILAEIDKWDANLYFAVCPERLRSWLKLVTTLTTHQSDRGLYLMVI
jgi:hypothetical protein